jgi:hypothetical protein
VTKCLHFDKVYPDVAPHSEEEAAMKNLLVMSAFVAASLLFSAPAFSEEKTTGLSDDYGQYKAFEVNSPKDQCLIVAKNCTGDVDSVVKRVERINKEIKKGTTVYTPDELRNLQEQLNWIYYESNEYPPVAM